MRVVGYVDRITGSVDPQSKSYGPNTDDPKPPDRGAPAPPQQEVAFPFGLQPLRSPPTRARSLLDRAALRLLVSCPWFWRESGTQGRRDPDDRSADHD